MALGDVCLVFGILLSLGIATPGLLVAWALLLPGTVGRAEARLARGPGRCLGLGLGVLLPASIALRIAFAVPGLGVLLGWLGIAALLALASLGAAGLAALMGARLRAAGAGWSPGGATLRGAVALELALVFPIVGWFVLLPLVLVAATGAVAGAIVAGRPRAIATAPALAPPPWPVAAPPAPPRWDTPTPAYPAPWGDTERHHARHTS